MSEPINGHRPDPRQDLQEAIRQTVLEAVKLGLAKFPSAYLVLMNDGQVMSGHFDLERAEEKAGHIEGVVVAVPIIADFRTA